MCHRPNWSGVASVVFAVVCCFSELARSEINKPLSHGKSFPYIYADVGNPSASYPVVEHLAISDRPDVDESIDHNGDDDRPEFLFGDTGTYRIVEFYVHWCDICKNFKPHFVQLGKRVKQLASSGNNSSDSVQIDIHAVSCAPNRPLCRALAIDQYPYFRIFLPGDSQGFDVPHGQVNPITILQKMGIKVDETAENDEVIHEAKAFWELLREWGRLAWMRLYFGSTIAPGGKFDIHRSRENLRDDVHLSFDFAMRQGVFLSDDPLPLARADELFAWLRLLRKTLPISWVTLHAAVQSLIDNFDYVKRSESYMISILEEYAPPSKIWSMSCSHGEIDAGFTCGLWEMFHTVTVGVVDYNRGAAFHRNRLATEDVARSIRSFVDTFFPCEICRRNFVAMFDSCAYRRCEVLHFHISEHEMDWIQLPLWLLDTHNGVNIRLMKEKAERENRLSRITVDDEIAVTWPPSKDCPHCWLSDGAKSSATMYKFLKLEYGQRDVLSSEYREELEVDLFGENTGRDLAQLSYYHNFMEFVRQTVSQCVALAMSAISRQPGLTKLTLEDRRADVYLFFITSLQENVFPSEASPELTDDKKALLKDWLNLLSKTLPVSWYEFHSLIQELLDSWAYVSKNRDYLLAVLEEFPPREKEWSTSECKSEFGYICALFEMYHVVAMGLVHYNKFIASSDNTRLATADVANILRGYVAHFLKSSYFRRDVLESIYQMCSRESCRELLDTPGTEQDWVYLPLWVAQWRDFMSRDLSNASISTFPASSEKAKPIYRWPSSHQCPRCWVDNEAWDDDYVYKYLLRAYGQESILTVEVDDPKLESPLQDIVLWIGNLFPNMDNSRITEIMDTGKKMVLANEEL